MAKIEKLEDINAWQKARELVRIIYDATNRRDLAKDYSLRGCPKTQYRSFDQKIA